MAASQIFDSAQTLNGAFVAEYCGMTGSGLGDGAIVQRVQFNIERPINFIYEIGSGEGNNYVYYVGGRRRGTASFERVVGGSSDFKTFVTSYGKICEPSDPITLKAKGGCKPGQGGAGSQGVTYKLKDPKLTGLGVNVTAEQIIILENVQLQFLDLDYEAA